MTTAGFAIEPVARLLLGDPNRALSTKREWRYGRKGSLAVDLKKHTYYDHEAGAGGGVLDLVVRERGGSHREAMDWLKTEGLADIAPNGARAGNPAIKTYHGKQNCEAISDDAGNPARAAPNGAPGRRREAWDIWRQSRPALHTPAQDYLQARGITIELPQCIRYHEGIHALVAAVQRPDGRFAGVQRIYLNNQDRDYLAKRSLGPVTGSLYRALASDAPAAHGLAPSFVAADELAQWKRRELFEVLRTAMGKRPEALMAIISTQSAAATNVLSELIDYGERVRTGDVDDQTFHSRLFTVPDDADPWHEENWLLANPGLDVIRSLDEMRQEAARAQRMPTFEPAFRNLYLNQRVDASPRAIDPAEWEACAGEVDAAALAGRPCWGGLDLSATRDMTAFCLFFPLDGGAVLPLFWIPRDGISMKEAVDGVPLRTWVQQGLVTATPGAAINKRQVAVDLAEAAQTHDIKGIAFDHWGMAELKRILAEVGIELPLEEWGQGFKDMGPAASAFEVALADRQLNHGGNPVLRWQSRNLVFETDPAGNRKPAKNRATERIDAMAALMMAIGLYSRMPKEEPAAVPLFFAVDDPTLGDHLPVERR